MRSLIRLTVLVSFLMVPGLAFAQSGADQGGADSQEVTEYNFDGEDLTGGLMRPDGERFTGDQRGKTSSLINIRQDFIPEMLKSVETL